MIDPNVKYVSAESMAHIKYAIIVGVNLLTTDLLRCSTC